MFQAQSAAPSGHWYWLVPAFPAVCLGLVVLDISLLRACACFVLLGVPLLDVALGEHPQRTRPPRWAEAVLPSAVLLHIACVLAGMTALAARPLALASIVDASALGVCTALGLNVSHACCHTRKRSLRALGQLMNALCAQLQAPAEHKHHHAAYASAGDPATAPRGETFYRFAPRYYIAAFRYLAETETRRAAHHSVPWWRKRSLWFLIIPVCLVLALAASFGPTAALYFLLQALVATTMLELGAYVTHYGLDRALTTTGKIERPSPAHSWNDSHFLSKFLLLGVSEHSHHHKLPDAPFWTSESDPEWPRLPAPYSLMVLVSLFPPLFRRWMDPLLTLGKTSSAEVKEAPGLPSPVLTALESMSSLAEVVEYWAERTPKAVAVLDRTRSYTYPELLAAQRAITQSAEALGLTAAHRVALIVDDSALSAVVLHALSSVVPVLPSVSTANDREFCALLDLADVRLVVCMAKPSNARLDALSASGVIVWQVQFDDARLPYLSGPPAPAPSAPIAACLLMPTSGTTSKPRIVPITRPGALTGARTIARAFELTPADRCLNLCSLSHVSGQFVALFCSWVAGGSVICVADAHRPDVLGAHLGSVPTWLCAVPTMLQRLVALEAKAAGQLKLRFVHSGTAGLPAEAQAAIEQAFSTLVIQTYGMTETLMIACTPQAPGVRKPGTVGIVQQDTRIIDEEGRELPPGELGEIAVFNSRVTDGYLGEAPLPRLFATGDLGRVDADGYLSVVGRRKEMINRGGEKISPTEIDALLERHPDVLEACCFGYGDPVLGEEVAAAVVLRPLASVTEQDLRTHVGLFASRHKVPRRVLFVDQIPRTHTGKKQRSILPGQLSEQLANTPENRDRTKPTAHLWSLTLAERQQELSRVIANIAGSLLGTAEIDESTEFIALGFDSVELLRLAQQLSSALESSVSLTDLFRHSTCGALAQELASRLHKSTQASETVHTTSRDRPLSYTEHNFVNALEHTGSGVVVEGIIVRGPLTREVLQQAVRTLTAREPLLQVHLEGTGFRRRFQVEGTEPVAIMWSRIKRGDVPQTVDELINRRTFAQHSPLLEVHAFELLDEPSCFALCLRIHHAICDAGGRLSEELLHICAAYSRNEVPSMRSRDPLAPADLLVAKSRLAGPGWFATMRYARDVLRQDLLPLSDHTAERRTVTLRRVLSPQHLTDLEARARDLGVSTYALLVSCLMCAIREETPTRGAARLSLMSFVDLRPHYTPPLPPGSLGFHVSALLTQHRMLRDTNTKALAVEIAAATGAALRQESALRMFGLSAFLLRLAVRHPRLAGAGGRTTVVTASATETFTTLGHTIGPFHILDLCCGVSTHGVGPCITFVMQGFQSGMHCLIGYPEPLVQADVAERVAQSFMEHVTALLEHHAMTSRGSRQHARWETLDRGSSSMTTQLQ